jgi:hypothetical protein
VEKSNLKVMGLLGLIVKKMEYSRERNVKK